MSKINISVCIISYNEEKKIEDCLISVKELADEIIIVDSLSTDKTVEIAKKYTDKIYIEPFRGYVKQKNRALELASNDWVLCIDCDERLSERLSESIKKIKEEGPKFDGYYLNRLTYYVYHWMRYSNWYPEYKLRLFNKKKGKWSGNNLHETVNLNGKTKKLEGDLYHYSFDTIEDHINTIQKFTTIGADELYKKGKKITIFGMIGHSFFIFFKMYILRRGFLDGSAGFIAAVLSSFHVFTKYAKLYTKYKMQKHHNNSS